MIMYIILGLVVLYLLFIVYCKIRYRFWSTQPVFHLHNLYYWLFPPGIIQHALPPVTKFYDPFIEFYKMEQLSAEKKELFYRLNKQHYLLDEHIAFLPTKESIFSYFEKHGGPCFIVLLFEEDPLFHISKKSVIPRKKCIASLTSRPLQVSLHNKKMSVNYVDYLCVHKKNRKRGVAPKMIYTYYVKSRRAHDTVVYLFKREGVGTFITPLTVYPTYGFNFKKCSLPLHHQSPLLITTDNFSVFYHYIKDIRTAFPCCITPALSHLKHLIEKKLLYIFLLIENNNPWGCYIFRNPYTQYEDKGMSIDCIASYCSNEHKIYDFTTKFFYCFPQIEYNFDYLLIENISHNHHIIKNILERKNPFLKSSTSYYLYNFAYRPFLSKEAFILS